MSSRAHALLALLALAACTGDTAEDTTPDTTPEDTTPEDTAPEAEVDPCDEAGADDADGDGLTSQQECDGWSIWVDTMGYGVDILNPDQERVVTSDPTLADSDGDGLDDATEKAWNADPLLPDTDGDLLDDIEEIDSYLSLPNTVDSDGDARSADGLALPSPQLFDGNEISDSGTSPILADTDADGLWDHEEIINGTMNPLLADLPKLNIKVAAGGDPLVVLNSTTSGGAISATLESTEKEVSNSDTTTTEEAYSFTESVSAEVEYGVPPAGSVEVSFEASQSFSSSAESSTSLTSATAAEDSFETSKNYEYTYGTLTVTLEITNDSDLTVSVDRLSVRAERLEQSTRRFTPIATLSRADGVESFDLAPGEARLITFTNAEVPAELILDLLADPTVLSFEAEDLALTRRADANNPVDYSYVMEDVHNLTALVSITRAAGETVVHSVATNVRRNPDGTTAGLTLREALDIIGVPYEIETLEGGSQGITSIDGVANVLVEATEEDEEAWRRSRVWAVMSEDGVGDPDELIIEPRDRISLVYVTDQDADKLLDINEAALGTDDQIPDFDGDLIPDGDEALGTYGSTSNPAAADSDGAQSVSGWADDGMPDPWELFLGSDPNVSGEIDQETTVGGIMDFQSTDMPALLHGDSGVFDFMRCNAAHGYVESGEAERVSIENSTGIEEGPDGTTYRGGCDTFFLQPDGEEIDGHTVRVLIPRGQEHEENMALDVACFTPDNPVDVATRVDLAEPTVWDLGGEATLYEYGGVPADCTVGVTLYLWDLSGYTTNDGYDWEMFVASTEDAWMGFGF